MSVEEKIAKLKSKLKQSGHGSNSYPKRDPIGSHYTRHSHTHPILDPQFCFCETYYRPFVPVKQRSNFDGILRHDPLLPSAGHIPGNVSSLSPKQAAAIRDGTPR